MFSGTAWESNKSYAIVCTWLCFCWYTYLIVLVLLCLSVYLCIHYYQIYGEWSYSKSCLRGALWLLICGALEKHSITYSSEIVSSSKWNVWFASRCSVRRLSTWQMTAASCPTELGALCGQLTFRLAYGAANTQQLQRQNICSRWTSLVELSSGPAAQSRHHLQTVQTTAEGTLFSGSMNTALCDFWYAEH